MPKVLVVVTDPELPELGADPGAEATRLSLGRLDRLCERREVPGLSEFVAVSSEDMLDLPEVGDPDDSEQGSWPLDAWFEAAAGLVTIRALLKEIVEGSVSFAMATAISMELHGVEDRLVVAEKRGARFRLEPRD